MGNYVSRRLLQLIPTLFGVYTLAFFLMRILPGDAAKYLAGFRGNAAALVALRAKMNLDEPVLNQYVSFLARLVRFDLGNSFITGQPVTEMIGAAIPVTLQLALMATILALAIG